MILMFKGDIGDLIGFLIVMTIPAMYGLAILFMCSLLPMSVWGLAVGLIYTPIFVTLALVMMRGNDEVLV